MLTGHGDVSLAVRAIKAGAIEFLEKPFDRFSLLTAIDQAFAHARHCKRSKIDAADAVTRLHVLTARERDVLEGMVQGQPNNPRKLRKDKVCRFLQYADCRTRKENVEYGKSFLK